MEVTKGTKIKEYIIEEEIGVGRLSTLYKAKKFKNTDESWFALKILEIDRKEVMQDEATKEEVGRFIREAKIGKLLGASHKNIVTIYDYFEWEGFPCIVMEYLAGDNLFERLSKEEESTGSSGLPVQKALHITWEIANGLEFLHQLGIVHRDIKPSNIIIEKKTERVVIIDLGLAKAFPISSNKLIESVHYSVTHPGVIIGTPEYIAPEQIESPEKVDHRTDIYGLGATFYTLLTDQVPFYSEVDVIYTIFDVLHGRFPALPQDKHHPLLEEFISKMTAKNPKDRFSSMKEVKKSIQKLLLKFKI